MTTKRERLIEKIKGTKAEIPIDQIGETSAGLAVALNNYAYNFSTEEKVNWLVKFLKQRGHIAHATAISKGNVYTTHSLRSLGSCARLLMLGLKHKDLDETYIIDALNDIKIIDNNNSEELSPKEKEVAPPKYHHNQLFENFDYAIDESIKTGRVARVVLQGSKSDIEEVIAECNKLNNELHDPEATEYYLKPTLKVLREFVKQTLEAYEKMNVKKPRKKREPKPKPKSKIVARLNFMQRYDEFDINCTNKEDLIGAQEAIIYDTKKRKIIVVKGAMLNVKGASITGFDPNLTYTQYLREPQRFFAIKAEFAVREQLKHLRTKQDFRKFSGRILPTYILIQVRRE